MPAWLRTLCAIALILLALSPLTAPFSTFDLGDLQAESAPSMVKAGPSSIETWLVPPTLDVTGPFIVVAAVDSSLAVRRPVSYISTPTNLRL